MPSGSSAPPPPHTHKISPQKLIRDSGFDDKQQSASSLCDWRAHKKSSTGKGVGKSQLSEESTHRARGLAILWGGCARDDRWRKRWLQPHTSCFPFPAFSDDVEEVKSPGETAFTGAERRIHRQVEVMDKGRGDGQRTW